jgi:hypothetical protein
VLYKDSTASITKLLLEFKDFNNVFNIEQASILIDYSKFEYIIKIIRDPLFRPLYNLS